MMQSGLQTAWTLSSTNCKIPVRHTFTLDQKRILMKHYETGMTGQSLAYHSRIMQCAQEAGVDFDIVRNWIGNMRRKKRMEETQMVSMHTYMSAMPHSQSPENMAKRVRLMSSLPRPTGHGSYFVNVHSPAGMPMIRAGQVPPHMGVPLEAHLPPRNTPLSPRDQNVAHVGAVPQIQANRAMMGAKIEPGENRNDCQLANNSTAEGHHQQQQLLQQHPQQADTPRATPASSSIGEGSASAGSQDGHAFPEDTAPMVVEKGQEGMGLEEVEWKQQEVNRILDNIQQSMHQLETLGCECLMATVSPIDNGTYVAGTEKAIKYFTDIQKIQPMSEAINGGMSPRIPDNMSVFSDDAPSDATEERPHSEDTKNGQGSESNGKPDEKQTNGQGLSEDVSEEREGEELPGEEQNGGVPVVQKKEAVINSGEEVFIVNKDHYIIGTGTLLPTPHKQIELKNFCPAS